jgi:hypothetical protein
MKKNPINFSLGMSFLIPRNKITFSISIGIPVLKGPPTENHDPQLMERRSEGGILNLRDTRLV